jgi:beta-galactosidase
MNKFIITSIISISFLCVSCKKNEKKVFKKQKFNDNWVFKKTENLKDTYFFKEESDYQNWELVQLPHTTKIEPKIVNNQWQGISWYKKEFNLNEKMKNKKLFFKFEGAMNIAEVFVNGIKLITHQGGYLPFTVDFTNVAKIGKQNTISVKLDNRDNPITGPKPLKNLDFNTYGGIYRNVWLIAKNKLHITDAIFENKTASGGIFVSYPMVSKEEATIKIKTHIKNENSAVAPFLIRNTLLKNEVEIIFTESESYQLNKDQDKQFTSTIVLKNPKLWSPNSPNLYHLKTEIFQKGKVVDQEITRIGIKNINFIGQDFYLNGEKTFLRGVNRHQEYPYIGYALSDNANYRDAKKIKDAGFDYVRLSHYPQTTSFMDACDELGLITIDAILGWQYFSENKDFQKHIFQTAKDLIRRDRNHASVIAWEVSLNESWMTEPFIDSLTTIAHKEYPGDQSFTAGWQSYGYDIYLQARQHRLQHFDAKMKKPYNVSEYGDWEYYAMNAGLSQDSWGNLLQAERSSRQLRSAGERALLQQATNIQEAHNDNLNTAAFADGYWVMFDYNRGYADDLETSGIMDIFRIPKPAYYFYQSQRDYNELNGNPVVYIANEWKKDSPLEVRIFSNCHEIELFLNGKSLGRQKPDTNRISTNLKHPPFTFSIDAFKEGKLEAKGYIDTKFITSFVVNTPGKASKIKVLIDDNYKDLKSINNDVFFVNASVVDENNTIISNFTGSALFTIEGNGKLIGENPVFFEAGVASIVLQANTNLKGVKVKVTSKELDKITSNKESYENK